MTVPEETKTPPPKFLFPNTVHSNGALPPVMLSPISCTTPSEPGLMISTRRPLTRPASSTTEPATAASRMTLLVMLSWAVRR